LAVALGQFMVVVDVTIVNIALPAIARDLRASLPELEWAVIAYSLTMIGLVPTLGRLSDVMGRKRLYVLGLAIFGAASLLAGQSQHIFVLVMARVVQAIGGALITSNTLAILTDVFPPGKRGVAMGLQSILIGTGAAVGPVLGGFLVTTFGWEAIFWVNVPVSLVASAVAWSVLPASPARDRREPIDWTGAALLLVALVATLAGVSHAPEWGWGSRPFLALTGVGSVAFALFAWRQRVAPSPIIQRSLFRNWPFVAGQLAGFFGTMAMISMVFTLPFYWQALRGESARTAGLFMLPLPLAIMCVSPLAGRLSDKLGARGLTTAGLGLVASGAWLLSWVGMHTPVPDVLWRVALIGIGLGAFLAPNTSVTMSAAPESDRGAASGLLALFRFLGQSSGIVAAGTLLGHFASQSELGQLLEAHSTTALAAAAARERLLAGFHAVCVAVVPIALAGTLVSFARGPKATADSESIEPRTVGA